MIKYYHKLIYFLPVALITGPFLPDLIVVLCSIFFLIDTFRLKLYDYYNNSFFKLFILFFITLNVSSFFSENINSFKYTIGYLRYGIFSIFIFYLLKNYLNFRKNIIFIFFFTFIFLILDGYIQYFFGKNILFFEIEKYQTGLEYVTSFFGEEKKLGSYLSRLAPFFLIAIILIKQKYDNKISVLYFFLIPLLYILILLTTERTSIFIITSLLFFGIFIFNQSNKYKIIFSIIFILIIIFILSINPSLFVKIKSVFYSIGIISPGYTADGKVIGGYDQGLFFFSKFYHDQVLNSLKLFKENIFFGIGAKNYKLEGFDGWHPHNFHAQLLAEIGLIGYLVFLFAFITFFLKIIKILFININKKNNLDIEMKNLLIFIVLINLLPIPTGDFFNNWLNIILYLPFGFILFLNEKKI